MGFYFSNLERKEGGKRNTVFRNLGNPLIGRTISGRRAEARAQNLGKLCFAKISS